MTEPKQTAVEWLFQVIPYRLFLTEDGIKAIKAQALEIEREYIAEAKQEGFSIGFDEGFKQGKEN